MEITSAEKNVLQNIAENNFADGQEPEEKPWIWSDCIEDNGPNDIASSSVGGIVSSLVKKGLVDTSESGTPNAGVCLTDAGVKKYRELFN